MDLQTPVSQAAGVLEYRKEGLKVIISGGMLAPDKNELGSVTKK